MWKLGWDIGIKADALFFLGHPVCIQGVDRTYLCKKKLVGNIFAWTTLEKKPPTISYIIFYFILHSEKYQLLKFIWVYIIESKY